MDHEFIDIDEITNKYKEFQLRINYNDKFIKDTNDNTTNINNEIKILKHEFIILMNQLIQINTNIKIIKKDVKEIKSNN